MEWEKKGHEEKQLDNYLSGVGKATGIPGDTRISNNCLLITDIFPSCLFFNNVRMGALCRPPSLAWPAGPSGRAWFRSSHLALRKREGYVKDGGVLPGKGHGGSGGAGSPSGVDTEARGIFTAVSPQNRSAKRPTVHQNLSFAAHLPTSWGKKKTFARDPWEACSSDSPAKCRLGQTQCLLGVINFSRAEANSRGSSGSQPWRRSQQSRPLGLAASIIYNPGVWLGGLLQVVLPSFPDTKQGSSWIIVLK